MQALLDGLGVGAEGAMVQRRIGRCEEEVGISDWTSKGTCRAPYASVSHDRVVRSLNGWIYVRWQQGLLQAEQDATINDFECTCLIENSKSYGNNVTQPCLPKLGQLSIHRLCGYKRQGSLPTHDCCRHYQRPGIRLIFKIPSPSLLQPSMAG